MLNCSVPCLQLSISSSIWEVPLGGWFRAHTTWPNSPQKMLLPTLCFNQGSSTAKDCCTSSGVICLVHPWWESQYFASKKCHDYQAAIEWEWEWTPSPSSINITVQVQDMGRSKKKYIYFLGKKLFSLLSMLKSTRCQRKEELPIPTKGKCSQLWVRNQMLEKGKVSNVPACTVWPTGNFLIHLLSCSGLHSHASLSLIPMWGAQLRKSSLFHSRDLKIKYCNTWLVQQD